MIKAAIPYLFILTVSALTQFMFNHLIILKDKTHSLLNREISSDCQSLLSRIIIENSLNSPRKKEQVEFVTLKKKSSQLWSSILGLREFENFDENEYFYWIQTYRDTGLNNDKLNPISIEQKMALIEVINEKILNRNLSRIQQNDAFFELNLFKLTILKNHFKKLDLSSPLSRQSLKEFSSDLALILKGPPATMSDYFTKNKSQRMSDRLSRMLLEDLISYGLEGMIKRIPERSHLSSLERARLLSKKIFKYKIWKLFVLPYDLPWFEKIHIPDELLEKILIDGIDKHQSELIIYLKSQEKLDHYERFRRVYKPVALSAAIYFFYLSKSPERQRELTLEKEEEKEKLIMEFNNMTDAILDTKNEVIKPVEEIKHDIREAHFQRVLKAFREEYKEDPTPEEYQEMRQKIFGNK